MKRAVTVIGGIIFALALAASLLKEWLSSGELKVPERPASVPSSATWIGGEWVQCSQSVASPVEFRCEFYDDANGKKMQEGKFVWRGRGEVPLRAGVLLEQPGWDGTALSFDAGKLVPAEDGQGIHPDRPI